MRQPSLEARSPPACTKGFSIPMRSYAAGSASSTSPPQIVPSVPYPVPSSEMPMTFSVTPFSAMQDSTCA